MSINAKLLNSLNYHGILIHSVHGLEVFTHKSSEVSLWPTAAQGGNQRETQQRHTRAPYLLNGRELREK